jgi:hypothetical protein
VNPYDLGNVPAVDGGQWEEPVDLHR